ncbi:MAG TPA: hypothetical protein VGT04_09975 [Acidobacteriaceae bacterium]|nr:hypothetical protein [Acidobacteriaceae bacterium]
MSRNSWFRIFSVAAAAVIVAFAAGPLVHGQVSFTSVPLPAGFGQLDTSAPPVPVPQLIKEFTEKESMYRDAMNDYTYERSVMVQTVNDDNKVDGQYFDVTDISYDPTGRKVEHVVDAPVNTLERVIMTPADFSDIEHRLPFVLTTEDAAQYNITYVGKQRIDDVDTYVFNVEPKVIEKGHRYFDGRIWVDQQDHQIVVTDGKNVPDDLRKGHEDLSLPFITYRQQIDGKYWFPVYTHEDGELHFTGDGYQDVHLRETVKYTNYKRFRTSIRVLYGGQDITGKQPEQPQTPPKKPQ